MEDAAQSRLWESLKPEETYDPAGLPSLGDPEGEGEAFLWDELLENAREDGNLLSFLHRERDCRPTNRKHILVPSAESFAKARLALEFPIQ